jgi:hypothetical protein
MRVWPVRLARSAGAAVVLKSCCVDRRPAHHPAGAASSRAAPAYELARAAGIVGGL